MKGYGKYRIYLSAIIGVILISISSCTKIDTTVNLQAQLQSLVDNELATYKGKVPDYPGGLAMEVISKQGTFFASSGMGTNVTDGIHFRAASNTKTFTSTAILLLYQQGKLDINHTLTDTIPGTHDTYLPNTPEYNIPYKNSITILELLRHRAGIFDVSNDPVPDSVSANVPYKGLNYVDYTLGLNPAHTFTFDELVNVVAQCKLFYFSPNNGYHYSNTGYSLLGKIIERVSKKSYQQFLMENIISPMGLHNTSMPVSGTDQSIPTPFATGYLLLVNSQTDVTISNISANVAEGSIITTPHDLGYFLRKLLSGQGVLDNHIINAVMMNYLPTGSTNAGGYGCGLTYTNNLGYGHNGAHEGYLSQMVYDPVKDITIVSFTNCWNMKSGITSLGYQLTNLLEDTAYKAKAIFSTN